MAMTATPLSLADTLRVACMKFLDSNTWIRNDAIRAERRALLKDGADLIQDVLLEPIVPYVGSRSGMEVCADFGLTANESSRLLEAIFGVVGDEVALRDHQADAMRAAGRGSNPIVTSGTGSGKTEAFLLPVLARLMIEARTRRPAQPVHRWWEGPNPNHWQPVRQDPEAAMRTLVLYPMNALVEDQLARLRRTLRRLRTLGGPDIWFGRYTSASPGGSKPLPRGADNRVADVRKSLSSLATEFLELSAGLSEKDLAHFQDPTENEMVSRWDMIDAPPDVLVTNYSMLNVMLMRQLEAPVFERTRRWLAEDSNRVFTLVVDELHLYRGSPGAEVALILRNLYERIGLDPDSPQLRVIGTSASLSDAADSRHYLERFFGAAGDSFELIPGHQQAYDEVGPLSLDATLADMDRGVVPAAVGVALAQACRGAGEAIAPFACQRSLSVSSANEGLQSNTKRCSGG